MFGNWATGRLVIATAPMMTVRDCDHHRHDGSIDEEVRHLNYFPFASLEFGENGFGLICAPGATFCTPSATTRSPGFSPLSTTHIGPTRSPTVTVAMLTLLLLSTDRNLVSACSSETARWGTSRSGG